MLIEPCFRYIVYSLVSWLVPLALAVAAVALDANPASVPESVRPHFGESGKLFLELVCL